jgi:DNA-binding NtrC family response regulator
LFGHVRGAFTSADRSRTGRFEAAGRGTLLLDEIDALALKEQAKLLRVIETGEFEPVGSTETRISEARLVVASNLDLETLATQNKFRTDLYYRLNVLQFVQPPLRERPLDVVPMAMQFIGECSQRHNIGVTRVHREFLAAVKRYQWPGNIREMKNQLQRSVLFCDKGALSVDHLSPNIAHSNGAAVVNGNGHAPGPSWSLA